jgi:hypothetical protein
VMCSFHNNMNAFFLLSTIYSDLLVVYTGFFEVEAFLLTCDTLVKCVRQ